MKEAARPAMRADAARNREKVLESADRLFTTAGLKTQMDEVAELAGVGVGTVYRHFPTKENLIEAVVARIFESLLQEAEAALKDPDPGAGFRSFFTNMAEIQGRHRAFAEEMAAEIGMPVKAARLKKALHKTITKLVSQAQADGAIRNDIGPADIAMLLSGIAHAVEIGVDFEPDLRQRYINIILDGLRPLNTSPLPGRPMSYDDLQRLKKRRRS